MGKQAKANLERIVSRLEHQKGIHTAHVQPALRNDCQPKNATTQTLQTICHERNGNVGVRKACARVVLGIYLYS